MTGFIESFTRPGTAAVTLLEGTLSSSIKKLNYRKPLKLCQLGVFILLLQFWPLNLHNYFLL